MENKTGKYFKYAVGEIVLVVIGILIALTINNWNEERKEKTIVKNVLKDIRNDLVADTTAFSKQIERFPVFINNAKSILDGNFSDTLSANDLYFKLPYTVFNFKIRNQSYEKILNTSITDFYHFTELFNDINNYYTINSNDFYQLTGWDYEDTLGDGKLWSAMNFEVDIYPDEFYEEKEIAFAQPEDTRKVVFLEQLKTPNMRNSIKNNIYRKMRLNEIFIITKQRAEDIIIKINEQLKE